MGGPWNPELHVKMFWQRVDKTPSCWLWTGKTHKRGYGELMVNRKVWRAHRYSYFLHTGEIPEVVRHTCDTPLCVRPDHLLPGTQQDNIRDREDRQRRQQFRGTENGNSKISTDDVQQIAELYESGVKQVDIASRFGLTQATVSKILRGATYVAIPRSTFYNRRRK